MNDTCLFKLIYHCNDTDNFQVSHSDGDRVHTIIDASKQQNQDLHLKLQTEL